MEKLSNISAISKSKEIWGDFYDYSTFSYVNARTPIELICPKHGKFTQKFHTHLRSGCFNCGKEKRRCDESIIQEFITIHNNKYDYSKTKYEGYRKRIVVICPNHGEFKILAGNHRNGNGCLKCSIDSQKNTLEYFINKSNKKHNYKYNYSMVEYGDNNLSKVKIICNRHGIFEQRPCHHLNGNGCPTCNESKGELTITKLLNELKVDYTKQHQFDNCKLLKKLKFDFYLPKKNTCIEYNGYQHYNSIRYFGGDAGYELRKKRDRIKEQFCIENKISLIVIKYDDDINDKLNFLYE